jgi:DNA-binding transcriptional ArsR family regulator
MGTLRIHFTAEDLSRTRLAPGPDPLWEIVSTLHRLQTTVRHPSYPAYAGWRHRLRATLRQNGLGPLIRDRLLPLAPLRSYFPDFLTPGSVGDIDAGIAQVLATPRTQLRAETARLGDPGHAAAWLADVGAGRAPAMRELGTALRQYFDAAVAPYWPEIGSSVSSERARRTVKVLGDGGLGELFEDLGPETRWEPPVLSVRYPVDQDVHLQGRGIILIPSYFCWHAPIALADPTLAQTLVYPARRRPHDLSLAASGRRLGPLIGHTRLAVLHATSNGATTGEIARRVGMSPATISHHTTILRDAGLVLSRREGNLVIHHLSGLGDALLGQPDPLDA